jgi:membrane protease YdiL (CAAX protease family)
MSSESFEMLKPLRLPILGAITAVLATTGMCLAGLGGNGFAALFPVLLIFWALDHTPRKQMGWAWGHWRHYGLALLHPFVIVGLIALICFAVGTTDISAADWNKAGSTFLSAALISVPLALLTEEGFFRGWLHGALQRTGMSELKVMMWTAIAFSAWHIPAVALNGEDALPLPQIPVLLINAVAIGVTWGMLRSISGSILVTSVCHSVWNAAVYTFFGFGETIGVLGVKETAVYGPESGLVGLALNLALAAGLWAWWKRRETQAV